MSIISVSNLQIDADVALVKGVSFEIKKGEILALVGESGSGKTLTALSVMGLLPAGLQQSGKIVFEQGRIPIRGRDMGMIFQEPMTSLNPLHTLGKQIGEAVRIHDKTISKSRLNARVLELLDAVGLGHFSARLNAYPHQLSGGERQRVMIAMAIANNPALLIADEPTTALDVTIQAQILTLLKELQSKLGMSVLLITHDLTIVRRIAGRVAIMAQGEIVETGVTTDIFKNPQHSYTKHLLASEPKSAPGAQSVNAQALLECSDLSVAYPKAQPFFTLKKTYQTVLNQVSFLVPEGSTLGIVGESGSGKTTLALALLRLAPSTGKIVFAGMAIDGLQGRDLRAKRRDMQIVFQDPYGSLNPRMTIDSIIREGLDVHEPAASVTEREARVKVILQEVGLTPDMGQRYPHEFSGGQRQRISIARALILKPKLIILDEPTSALDLSVQAQILALLKDLQQKHGLTYIFISHDLRTIRSISHHILVLQKGEVVETGSAEQIFTAPKAEYTRQLLEAAFGEVDG